jgi:hypothetical protein
MPAPADFEDGAFAVRGGAADARPPPALLATLAALLSPSDVQLLEDVFSTLCYLFKYLLRQLLADLPAAFGAYRPLLAHERAHVRDFAAESFSFLLRRLTASKLPSAVAHAILPHVGAHGAALDQGIAQLFFYTVRGLGHAFHSRAPIVVKALILLLHPTFGSLAAASVSAPLARGRVDFAPFVVVHGATSPAVTADGQQLCVDGLKHGFFDYSIACEVATGGKIYGFGHAVLRAEDPRAKVQYALGEELCPNDPWFRTSVVLRERAVKVLKENPKIQNPYPNVDAVSGALTNACGLTDPEYYTVLFGFSRISGIAAQIVDERLVARNGKGVPIYRCKYVAKDQPKRRLNA